MITDETVLQEMVGELFVLLDEEIRLLRLRGQQFRELYEVVLHLKDEQMEPLLEEMVKAQQSQAEMDSKLQALRAVIAKTLGLVPSEMKLEMLMDQLDKENSAELEYKRQQIILLAEQLKRRHLDAAVLLAENTRINRRLLEGLIPRSETITTYNTGGTTGWRDSTGLVDAEI